MLRTPRSGNGGFKAIKSGSGGLKPIKYGTHLKSSYNFRSQGKIGKRRVFSLSQLM
jgi:hypothetical protein